MEIDFAKVDKSSKHLSTQSMIGVRPRNYIKDARIGTINNVNGKVSIFTANTPQSQHFLCQRRLRHVQHCRPCGATAMKKEKRC